MPMSTPCLSQGFYIMMVVIFMTHASPRRRQLPPAFSFGITDQHQCSVNFYGFLMSSVRVDPKAITSDILYGNRKVELRHPVESTSTCVQSLRSTDSHLVFSGMTPFPRQRSWTSLSSPTWMENTAFCIFLSLHVSSKDMLVNTAESEHETVRTSRW